MKELRLVQDYLQDILDVMDKADEFVGSMNLNDFKKDDKTAYAVIRSFEISVSRSSGKGGLRYDL